MSAKIAVGRAWVLVGAGVVVVVVVVVAAGVGLGGKGAGGGRGEVSGAASAPFPRTPKPTASTGDASPVPEIPERAAEPTAEGAVAFFRFYWETFNYSYLSLDSVPLKRLSRDTCKSCSSYTSAIDSARDAGETFRGGAISVKSAVAAPGQSPDRTVVNALLEQAAAVTIGKDGATVASAPAVKGGRVDAVVRWEGDRWILIGMDTPTKR